MAVVTTSKYEDIVVDLDSIELDRSEIDSIIEDNWDSVSNSDKEEMAQEYLEDYLNISVNIKEISASHLEVFEYFMTHLERIKYEDLVQIVKTNYPGKEIL